MPEEPMTIPPVDRVEVYDARLPGPDDPSPHNATILVVFGCRIGPFVIRGVRLVDRHGEGAVVMMPRCRQSGAHITLIDPDVRNALKAAARRALVLVLAERDGNVYA